MAWSLRKVTKRSFIIVNWVLALLFLLVCCVGFLPPGPYWYIALLGIGFPFIVLFLILFIFFWAVFKSKWALLPLIVLVLGWKQVSRLFALHPFNSYIEHPPAGSIRIMQWNVSRFDQMNTRRRGGNFRQPILDFIGEIGPDILCIEEFFESNRPKEFPQNIPYFRNHLKYPYYFFSRDHKRQDGAYEHGVCIFSRFPIVDSLRIRYNGPDSLKASESLIHADINVNGQLVRVFATHLQSLRFDEQDYEAIQTFTKGEKKANVLRKFQQAYWYRGGQARLVRSELDKSPYPLILCGDFNDVPNSYTYSTIRGTRNDAFLAAGFGIGRTFASLSPTLRIDYIFCDKYFSVQQFKNTKLPWSDHYPLVADLALPRITDLNPAREP